MVITNWFGLFFTFCLPFLLLGLAAAGERKGKKGESERNAYLRKAH
jgi:hypothetical protein